MASISKITTINPFPVLPKPIIFFVFNKFKALDTILFSSQDANILEGCRMPVHMSNSEEWRK